MDNKEVRAKLIALGFSKHSSEVASRLSGCTWYTYRRLNVETKECLCNDRVPSISIEHFDAGEYGGGESYKIEIFGETDLGWVNFDYYGLDGETLIKNLDIYVERLAKMWETAWNEQN